MAGFGRFLPVRWRAGRCGDRSSCGQGRAVNMALVFIHRTSKARRCASGLRSTGRRVVLLGLLALALVPAPARAGQPIIWDDDQDGIDDRMETVNVFGYRFSFEN